MNISKILAGIVRGHRRGVPSQIREMNSRVNASHQASPWFGNTQGHPCSESYLQEMGYEDVEFCEEDVEFCEEDVEFCEEDVDYYEKIEG